MYASARQTTSALLKYKFFLSVLNIFFISDHQLFGYKFNAYPTRTRNLARRKTPLLEVLPNIKILCLAPNFDVWKYNSSQSSVEELQLANFKHGI